MVTRDREGPDESRGEGIWSIGDGTKAPGCCTRLETNWDHWTVVTDGRRQAANKAMAGIGQGFVDLGAMEAPRDAAGPRRRHGVHGAHLAERLGLPEYGAHAQRRARRG